MHCFNAYIGHKGVQSNGKYEGKRTYTDRKIDRDRERERERKMKTVGQHQLNAMLETMEMDTDSFSKLQTWHTLVNCTNSDAYIMGFITSSSSRSSPIS